MPYVGVVVEIGEHELKVKWFDKERSVDMCTTTSVQPVWQAGWNVKYGSNVGVVQCVGSFPGLHAPVTYNLMVWNGLAQEWHEARDVPVAALTLMQRPLLTRKARALGIQRTTALAKSRDWRDPPGRAPAMMRRFCEVRRSEATPRPDCLGSPGLGVFASTYIPDNTRLFWRLGSARLLPPGRVCASVLRYAMCKSVRPCLLVCPGADEWKMRDKVDVDGRKSFLGFGWRVNFAGPGDVVNVRLEHGGDYGDSLCFCTRIPINPREELLFEPSFQHGLVRV